MSEMCDFKTSCSLCYIKQMCLLEIDIFSTMEQTVKIGVFKY